MKFLAKIISIFFLLLISFDILAVDLDKNSFSLNEILFTHQIIASSKPSNVIDNKIPGSIILLNEKKYEIVSFIYEDLTGKFSEKTFAEYARDNNLLGMRGILLNPLENISFQVFDSSNAHLRNEAYFYLSIRPLKTQP